MKPHDHRDRWDKADVLHLKKWLGLQKKSYPPITYAEIGEKLGRTKEAVRAKARRLGLR